jgi:hypothetical protein
MDIPPSTAAFPPAGIPAPRIPDLEIKDAQLIFTSAWKELEASVGR